MKLTFACVLLISSPTIAQIPRAEAVDPALGVDAANDFFVRGKNLYDTAQASVDQQGRIAFFQRAVQIFSEYLNTFPNHPNAEMAWWYLGNSHYQSGEINEGKRCFSTLLNRYGKGKWAAAAAYTLAADHYNKSEYAFAAPMFERFAANAAKPEERPRGNYLAGNCYRLLNRDREAIASFRKVIEDPAGGLFAPQAKVALGHLTLKAGKLNEALAIFEEVVAANNTPKIRGEAALQAALTATKLDQTELADKYLRLVLSTPGMDTFRPDAQTALMGNHFAKKEYREVIEIFRRSSEKALGEKEATRLMIAARSYMRLKLPTEALQLFRDVEKLLNSESDIAFQAAYYRLLCFFEIEGRHLPEQVDAFLQLYRKSRKDDPRIHTALMMKAESLYASKKIPEAAQVYSEISASALAEENRQNLYFQRGWCLSESGDTQGAIRSFTEFISQYPKDPRVPSATAKRAAAYASSAEPLKAMADFDLLIKNPSTPKDLLGFAWLESARLRRAENDVPEMMARYHGVLKNVDPLSDALEAESNYWIGWGLVKTNVAADSPPYLEKARKLDPKAYNKHAGLLLALGYFATQNPQKLAAEIHTAIRDGYDSDIPNQAIQWSAMQSYNSGEYKSAAKFLARVSNPQEPRETPKEVWRYLAKARLRIGDAEGALVAADHILAVETDSAWKADGLLDRGQALLKLDSPDEARKAAEEALGLGPQGHTSAGLSILIGDLELKAGDPKTAAGKYQVVVQFHEDKELKPLAYHKLVLALEKQGDQVEAAAYRAKLQAEFPDWKPPAL